MLSPVNPPFFCLKNPFFYTYNLINDGLFISAQIDSALSGIARLKLFYYFSTYRNRTECGFDNPGVEPGGTKCCLRHINTKYYGDHGTTEIKTRRYYRVENN